MADQSNQFQQGFAEGRKAMFNEIVSAFNGEQHHAGCRCESCRVMRLVMQQYLGTMREMLGERKYHSLANDLATAAGERPRPFRR